jgi:hypothetical protein
MNSTVRNYHSDLPCVLHIFSNATLVGDKGWLNLSGFLQIICIIGQIRIISASIPPSLKPVIRVQGLGRITCGSRCRGTDSCRSRRSSSLCFVLNEAFRDCLSRGKVLILQYIGNFILSSCVFFYFLLIQVAQSVASSFL